ncbi:MAG TPA: response regulator transcription factor [Clostridiaceae bacterium]|nr:response regulator transcription factor [Clostridiaceae bacterium]
MRIGIIDDHPLVKQGLISVLSLYEDFEIVGEATNCQEGIVMLMEKRPEIALIDLKLGNECGLDIIREVKNKIESKFVILTSSAEHSDFLQAEILDVDGYILKEALPEELIYGLRLVYKGRKYYDPGLVSLQMKKDNDPLESLTQREKEVLLALGGGLSNKEISQKLYVTEHTVKKHVSQILAKLDLADRTQAIIFAYNKGLIGSQNM